MDSVEAALSKGAFDLRQVLAERAYPTEDVTFYVDEDLGYAVLKIQEQIDILTNQVNVFAIQGNKKAEKDATDALASAEAKLEETHKAFSPYVAHIRSISRRARYDLQSKALHAVPIKRDLFGNDDPTNEFERAHYMDQLIWAAHIQSITSPDGRTQNFSGSVNDEDNVKAVSEIMDSIPESAYKLINAGIDKLLDDGSRFESAAQSEDFSSES